MRHRIIYCNIMKVLVAEDESSIAYMYRIILEKRNHNATITNDGRSCAEAYLSALNSQAKAADGKPDGKQPPFDAVVLDYRMPKLDGMGAAKMILDANPWQRIIFASAFLGETIADSFKHLRQVTEILQKPFELDEFVRAVEDEEIYGKMKELNASLRQAADSDLTKEQVADITKKLGRIQKGRTF